MIEFTQTYKTIKDKIQFKDLEYLKYDEPGTRKQKDSEKYKDLCKHYEISQRFQQNSPFVNLTQFSNSFKELQLANIIIELDAKAGKFGGILFPDKVRAQLKNPEGLKRGDIAEKAVRDVVAPGTKMTNQKFDFSTGDDVKLHQKSSNLGPIRSGVDAQIRTIAIAGKFLNRKRDEGVNNAKAQVFFEELIKKLSSNVAYDDLIKTHPEFAELVINMVLPYSGIHAATFLGSFYIPSCDFNNAYKLTKISQLDPRVILRREYLLNRIEIIESTFATQF